VSKRKKKKQVGQDKRIISSPRIIFLKVKYRHALPLFAALKAVLEG
jgi:hypothetical protein